MNYIRMRFWARLKDLCIKKLGIYRAMYFKDTWELTETDRAFILTEKGCEIKEHDEAAPFYYDNDPYYMTGGNNK